MEALLASFLESLAPAAIGGSEAVMSGGAAPMSFGDTLGGFAQNQLGQQMAPTMEAYNTLTNPNSTASDMLSGAYKYAFNPKTKEDEQMMSAPQMRMGGGMANNYVGGIPSLLQSYGTASQGILPYLGAR
jgi:hypothetical protein